MGKASKVAEEKRGMKVGVQLLKTNVTELWMNINLLAIISINVINSFTMCIGNLCCLRFI